MRLIPGKTKVKIELFKGVTLSDVIVGLVGLVAVTLCAVSSLPFRWIIAIVVATLFGLMMFRLDDEPMYVFLWHMLRYRAYPRKYYKVVGDGLLSDDAKKKAEDIVFGDGDQNPDNQVSDAEKKQKLKETIKAENKILKDKNATEEQKKAVWAARAARTAEKKKAKALEDDNLSSFEDIADVMPFTGINDGFIEYDGKYYGTAIEIDPVEFRFFSKHRRNSSIENYFGRNLRGYHGDYGFNIVKVQRPVMYEAYLDAEYDKLDALRKSYESGLLTEEELQARVEIQYDKINDVNALCTNEKVIEPFYYFVLFDTDKDRLDTSTSQAMNDLALAELTVRRLDDRGLALFLKYTNTLDFDEKEIDSIPKEKWAAWAMPQSLRFSMRRVEVDKMITHNMRVISYPTTVGDAWLAGVMSFPASKVVVKVSPMDKGKAVRTIDRSLTELRGQYMATNVDSKLIELQEHIDTLSSLLITLQQDNEALLSVNIYITGYDVQATDADPVLTDSLDSLQPFIADLKKSLKRSWSETGMKLSGMDFMQLQAFIGSQISAYDPMEKEARGLPSNTIAAMFPWIYAHISDVGGVKLGETDGVPVFINFFRRDHERVNSNMVIVGKSGSGKSYATKSLLANLASEDAKIFILDPENEYSELANTLHGKVINVGNAKFGRLNPFHIITALDDDEAGESGGGPGGSFATHLQFLEEFFRQILPDIDRDALEYLNSLVERVYLNHGITAETDLSTLTADDYPIFDDLYDVILAEFERTNNDYLRQLLRSLVNYISKFSTGGRNANIWNGPSTISTDENFSVFNFQSMLANRNTIIANAQMLLVLKYVDNEIIKNRDYNQKYGLNRKIVVVIDEAHVFIDTKFPVALDFMFQLAKRIRKYNGMQIVITQNIKDFVGSEEIARKSSAIINACQYSFVFGLAPNDMADLCKLYEKAGGINEREQEDIVNAKRGQAFTIMSPTSRSSFTISVPESMVDMFENKHFISNYFSGSKGAAVWEDFVAQSRSKHDANFEDIKRLEAIKPEKKEKTGGGLSFSEISEDEAELLITTGNDSDKKQNKEDHRSSMEKFLEAEDAAEHKPGGGGLTFTEITPEVPGKAALSATIAANRTSASSNEGTVRQEELDETLDKFRQSMREEMEKELADRLKWISLGAAAATAGQTSATAQAGPATRVAAAAAQPVRQTKRVAAQYAAPETEEDEDLYGMSAEDEYSFTDEALHDEEFDDEFDTEAGFDESYEGFGEDAGFDDEDAFGGDTGFGDEDMDFGDDEDYGSEDIGLGDEDMDFDDDEDYGLGDEEDAGFADEDESFGDEDMDFSDDDMDFAGDEDYGDSDEESIDDDDDEDDDDFDFDDDDDEDFYADEDSEDYEPAPFLFAELLAEAAEEYANMGIEERLDEMGEDVIEVTLEELAEYIKEQRKKR